MLFEDVLSEARAGKARPAYVFVGSERFLAERAIAALREATLGDEVSSFNEDVFQGTSMVARTVMSTARTLPMFAKARFILVRDVDAAADAELDALASYFGEASPSTCVVMTAEKLDARTRFAKQAKATDAWVDVLPMKAAGARSFALAEARTRGHKLDNDAADALIDATGPDLAAIDDALERLSLYVGAGAPITEEAVSACVAKVRVESIWALVDAVGMRDRKTVLRTAASLLADREPPLRILAMVARQLRMVAKMRDALASGQKPMDAAKAAGAPPFKANDLATSARRFSPPQLAAALRTLAETDLALKSSAKAPETILEEALLRL